MEVIKIPDSDSDQDVVVVVGSYQVRIPGEPQAMPRPRFWGNVVNTKDKVLARFKEQVKQAIPAAAQGPLFHNPQAVKLTIWFMSPRPLSHFVNKDRSRLKPKSRRGPCFPAIVPDIDNLAKLAMDGLNGIAYEDDNQVVVLHCYKMHDNQPPYTGAKIERFKETIDTIPLP
jgi:Holliday junction resolvase RusA-like endonuclease